MKKHLMVRATALVLFCAALLLGPAANTTATSCDVLTPSDAAWDSPYAGNPVIPGFWGDPSMHFFNGTWYLYVTGDMHNTPPVVWRSADLKNWEMIPMSISNLGSDLWAPSAAYANGRYYLYYCKGANDMFVAESLNPEGPWSEKAMLYSHGTTLIEVHDIDPQPFQDEDGTWYLYWGNGECRVARLNPDMISFAEAPRVVSIKGGSYTEGPFMVKRGGYYMLTYSGGFFGDASYCVRYATGTSPYGPFIEGPTSPILTTNADGSVHGPGHHSIFSKDGVDYIAYHRHANPLQELFPIRNIAIDAIGIHPDGTIDKVIPTHAGIAGFGWRYAENIARGKKTTASSSRDSVYAPARATDDNNATRWRVADFQFNNPQWLEVDLGDNYQVERTAIAFAFMNRWVKYKVEYSTDDISWSVFADRTSSGNMGICTDAAGPVMARYMRLTITEKQDALFNAGDTSVCEFKVFGSFVGGNPPPLSENKKTWASSSISASSGPDRAVDGSPNTRWTAFGWLKPQWLCVDLGEARAVGRCETFFEFTDRWYRYKIEHSLDNANWSSFADRTTNKEWGSPCYTDINQVTARYLRITVVETQNWWDWASIREFRVYGGNGST